MTVTNKMKALLIAATSLALLARGQTSSYPYVACNLAGNTTTQGDAFCRSSGVPLSCCAAVVTGTKASGATTYTNATASNVCLPSDYVATVPFFDASTTTRYFYTCPYSTTTTPTTLGGTASNLCSSNTDPCATQSFSCCATVTATVNGVSSSASIPSICIDKQYSIPWKLTTTSTTPAMAQVAATFTCMAPPSLPASSFA